MSYLDTSRAYDCSPDQCLHALQREIRHTACHGGSLPAIRRERSRCDGKPASRLAGYCHDTSLRAPDSDGLPPALRNAPSRSVVRVSVGNTTVPGAGYSHGIGSFPVGSDAVRTGACGGGGSPCRRRAMAGKPYRYVGREPAPDALGGAGSCRRMALRQRCGSAGTDALPAGK